MCNRMWTIPEPKGLARTTAMEAEKLNVVSEGCNSRIVSIVTFFSFFLKLRGSYQRQYNLNLMFRA